ncbi:MAG: O-antigen ligase family protein [Sulfurimonas sp.]|uniref:O-antigen ligase family protein n=1 Tax=Sulfurimonas sp. TaxID=2022749 RepID=UPI00260F0C4F|nr:O-antigen ligase family protein [Sulfurimonas sp.]MDD5372001.1 O-antigen ligase family protein [Sulfurimonas sp.]
MINIKKLTTYDYINYMFVLYAFLLPISRSSISILTALLFTLWLFTNNFKNSIDFLKSDKVIIYLLAFITFSILSLFWSDNIQSGFYYIRKYWYFLVIPVVASTIQKKYLEYALSAFLIGMLISEFISYGVFFELWSFKNATVEFPNPFMNHPQYSMFLAFTSLLLLNKIFYEESVKIKIFYSLFFLTTTINLLINAGRTGQAAFAASIFMVGFLNIKNKILAFFGILFLVISIFYAAYQVSPNFKARFDIGVSDINKVINDKNYCTSIGLRIGVWSIGGEIFSDNPLFGIGVTNEMDTLKDIVSKKYENMECLKEMPSYHNFYIQTAVHLGLIGLFFYLMIFYSLLKLNIHDRFYSNLAVIFVTVYSVSSLVETMFHEQFSVAFFTLFAGIFIAQYRIENEV